MNKKTKDMNTAEQYMEILKKTPGMCLEDVIEQAQKEAYNQALVDAVNSVKVVNTKKLNFETGRWENVPLIDQTSILKLKK